MGRVQNNRRLFWAAQARAFGKLAAEEGYSFWRFSDVGEMIGAWNTVSYSAPT